MEAPFSPPPPPPEKMDDVFVDDFDDDVVVLVVVVDDDDDEDDFTLPLLRKPVAVKCPYNSFTNKDPKPSVGRLRRKDVLGLKRPRKKKK